MEVIHFRMTEDAVDRFDWTLVRSFLAVLDAGSVTAAADRLGVGHGHGPIHHFHRFY